MTAPAAPHIFVRQNGQDIYVRWQPVLNATDYRLYISEEPFDDVLGEEKMVTGESDIEVLTTVAHGLSEGDTIVFTALTGGTGLSEDTTYFVIADGLAANTFEVSATLGGSAVDFTDDVTDGLWHLVLPPARLLEVSTDSGSVGTDNWFLAIATNHSGLTYVLLTALNVDDEESVPSNEVQVNVQTQAGDGQTSALNHASRGTRLW